MAKMIPEEAIIEKLLLLRKALKLKTCRNPLSLF